MVSMSKVNVVSNLIGGQTKAKFPSQMGSALSVNMYTETNGKITYQKSIPRNQMVDADCGQFRRLPRFICRIGRT